MLRRREQVFARMRTEMRKMGANRLAYSVPEAARVLGLTPQQIDAMASVALISTFVVGAERMIPASEVRRQKAVLRR